MAWDEAIAGVDQHRLLDALCAVKRPPKTKGVPADHRSAPPTAFAHATATPGAPRGRSGQRQTCKVKSINKSPRRTGTAHAPRPADMDLPPWGFGPPPGGLEMLFGGPPSPGSDDDDEMPVDVEQLLASILPRSFGGIEAFAQAQGMRRARPADRKRLDHLLDEHAYSEPKPDEVVEEAVVTTTRAGRSRLAKRKFDLEDVKDKINCPICIETRDPGCDCLRMPCCGQRFHRACAIKWLTKESDKCPTCRAPLQDAPKKKKRDYAKLPIAELRKRCEERDVPTKGVVEKKELVALLKDEAERDDERRKRLPPPGAVPIFVGAVPPPPPGAARAFADAAREAGLPPFLFGAGSPFGAGAASWSTSTRRWRLGGRHER